MQVVAATAMEAPSRGEPGTIKDAQVALFRSVVEGGPAHYVRGQYDGYLSIDGVADGSTTETYAALRLEIQNWRWAGVPFFIRTGKRLPTTQTEVRVVFKHPPKLGFGVAVARAESDRGEARPVHRDPGRRRRPPRRRARRRLADRTRHGVRSRRAARGRPRTRCCSTPRWSATARASPARTGSRSNGGSCSRCSTPRRRCTPTRRVAGGRTRPTSLVEGHGRWHEPWIVA